jgi:hypothetical protein
MKEPEAGSMRRILASLLVVVALGFAGCKSEEPKGGSGTGADTAKQAPCTKCACKNWTDANGDGKCDTLVEGKPCDHTKAEHKAP